MMKIMVCQTLRPEKTREAALLPVLRSRFGLSPRRLCRLSRSRDGGRGKADSDREQIIHIYYLPMPGGERTMLQQDRCSEWENKEMIRQVLRGEEQRITRQVLGVGEQCDNQTVTTGGRTRK